MTRIEFINANLAIAEGVMAAGLRFFAGYPITPTSDLFEYLAVELPKRGGVVIQFEDEIASINAVIGASWGGAPAMTATSGPGFSLMVEGLSFAIMTETPLLLTYIMRADPSTGVPTKSTQADVFQARYGAHGNYEIPVLVPWSAQEAYEFGAKALWLAERLRVPTILLSDATLAHTFERVEFVPVKRAQRKKPKVPPEEYRPYEPEDDLVPPMASFGEGYNVMVESLTHDERGYYAPTNEAHRRLIWRLVEKVRKNWRLIHDTKTYFMEGAEVAIYAYGSTARAAYAAVKELRRDGVKVGLVRPTALWPFIDEDLRNAVGGAKTVFVVENNIGLMYKEVARALRDKEVVSVPIIDLDLPTPDQIIEVVKEWRQ